MTAFQSPARGHKRKASGLSDIADDTSPSSSSRRNRTFRLSSASPHKPNRSNDKESGRNATLYMDDDELDAEGEDDVYMDEQVEATESVASPPPRNVERTPVRKARTIRLTSRPKRTMAGMDDTPVRNVDRTEIRDSHARPPAFSEEPEVSEEAKQAAKLEKEEVDMRTRWMEEYFDIVEQLPLEVHRMFALIRELEGQTQMRFDSVLRDMVTYRDARLELDNWITANAHKSGDDELHPRGARSGEEEAFDQNDASSVLDHAARGDLLHTISNAASESVKGAEEKMGLAISAYNLIDRHIRRLDGDISKMEASILLGLRSGTEESRGVRETLGLEVEHQDTTADASDQQDGRGKVTQEAESASLTKAAGASSRVRAARTARGDNAQATPSNAGRARANTATSNNAKAKAGKNTDGAAGAAVSGMAYDPTEPTYCYCDQVSVDEMVACDNDDCKLEWFHYACVGLESAPKGKWYCRFCAPPNWKGAGTAVPANAKFKPPGWKKGGIKG